MDSYTVQLQNKRVYEFYQNNPNLNFEAMNLLLIDFVEQLNNDLTKTLQNTLQSEILTSVKSLHTDVASLQQTVSNHNQAVLIKFHENNKEFLDSMKLVVDNAMNANSDKVSTSLDKSTEVFVSKMRALMPQNNEALQKDFQTKIEQSQRELSAILATQNPSKIEDYMKTMDQRLQSAQEPLLQYMKANQEQIKSQYDSLRDNAVAAQTNQDNVHKELGDFLQKFKSSSSLKGQYSENMIESILNKLYPMANVVNTANSKATGDFLLRRNGSPTVLIENKNYEANVSTDEVKKFLRDIREQQCHGLFLSQNSGIVNKSNYQIEIHDGYILVYIHTVEHDSDKIKTGIDIIDHLSLKLRDFYVNEEKGFTIDKETLDCINAEFQVFLSQKDTMVGTVRDFQKKMVTQIEELKMPELQNYLFVKYASVQNNDFACDFCGMVFANKRSLASHKKIHKRKECEVILDSKEP